MGKRPIETIEKAKVLREQIIKRKAA